MSSYGTSVTLTDSFDNVTSRVKEALAGQGFGVLTEIDVKATMKAKLDEDVDPYLIFGACNPALAHRALTAEPSLGLLLPCNVIIRATEAGTVVEAIDPMTMVQFTGNPQLQSVADEAAVKLSAALDTLR